MNKISPFVMMISKCYGHFGTLRSSYNILQITNYHKSTSCFVNNYDIIKYRINVIPIRYYTAQPKKQSTSSTEYDKNEIKCKSNHNNGIQSTTSNQTNINLKDDAKPIKCSKVETPADKSNKPDQDKAIVGVDQKPDGLFKRFKKMYKEYWYILLPVHIVTSVIWFGGFYYVSHSGVDVPALMESAGLSEFYIKPLRDSKLGHVAIAYLLYKVATPIRYTVTLGGSTLSIKYLVKRCYIKPVPSKNELIKKYKNHMIVRRDSKK